MMETSMRRMTGWFRMDAQARFAAGHVLAGGAVAVLLMSAAAVSPQAAPLGPVGLALTFAVMVLTFMPRLTGRVDVAQAASAFALAAFAGALAALTGGLQSPFLVWLLAAPVEALASGRRAAVGLCAGVSAAGVAGLAALHLSGALPPSVLPQQMVPLLSLLALISAMGAVAWTLLEQMRRTRPSALSASRTEAPVRQVGANGPDVTLELNRDGRIVRASDASRRLLGLDPAEIEGLSPGVLTHIADYQTLHASLGALTPDADEAFAQIRLRRKDGTFVWTDVAMRRAPDGGVVAALRDATRRKAEETALLTTVREAEEQSKSKSRFLASMSHELRTPLNAIIGFSDMIRQEVFGPVGHARYREYAGHIHSSGQHLVDMISDLLDMSKIEAGKFKLSLKPLEIAPLVTETLDMLRLQAEEAGVAMAAQTPRDLPLPMADRRAVKQILLNLVSNAIKFTPAQGRVTVAARAQDAAIVLEVRDTGVGIPEADLNRIGKPFEQVEIDVMRAQKGTGLGLSLVAALAELHGGHMRIESAPGDGTTVTVTLPLDGGERLDPVTVVFPEKFRAGGKG
jgi:cell cycle sensor histidine kinase DivJ